MPYTENNSLAIVGAACYLPGAVSLEEYWNNLFSEKIMITVPTEDRFDPAYYSSQKGLRGHTYSNLAATVDYNEFCRTYVPKLEKEFADSGKKIALFPRSPGSLLALYTAIQALRNAGMDPWNLQNHQIGTFCGLVSANNYGEKETPIPNLECLTDLMDSISSYSELTPELRERVKSRLLAVEPEKKYESWKEKFLGHDEANQLVRFIQNSLGLEGSAFCFDSACSSSLMSLEIARNYLKENKIAMAIVGGMTYFASSGLVHFANASANSASGAHPFEERANGLIPGEGCSFSIVKLLDRAIADGDKILGVIRGIGFSSDGRGKSLWAPSSEGQALAMNRAFEETGWTSYDGLDYVEAHATSTQLGDATELKALAEVMENHISPDKKIPITSVKANIGHALESAGMASLQKILLSLEHETILRQPNFQTPSSKFDWKNSHYSVPTENISWKPSKKRSAAVEAFGIGGLNTQVIIEGPESIDKKAGQKEGNSQKMENPMISEPVAIVGTGCILPGAFNVPALQELIQSGKSAITPLSPERPYVLFTKKERSAPGFSFDHYQGGFVDGYDYNWRLHMVAPKHVKFANPLQFMVLGAADEAIQSAGYQSVLQKQGNRKILDSKSTAVVVGTETDCDHRDALGLIMLLPLFEKRLRRIFREEGIHDDQAEKLIHDFSAEAYKTYPILDDETGGFTISTLASRITKTYNLMGGGFALDAGESSSFAALENAMHFLRHHSDIKSVLCVVGRRRMGKGFLEKYQSGEFGSSVPGEGVVAFFLKRLSDAQKDGDNILGVLRDIRGGFIGDTPEQTLDRFMDSFSENVPQSKKEDTICDEVLDGRSDLNDRVWQKQGEKFSKAEKKTGFLRDIMGDLHSVSGAAEILHVLEDFSRNGKQTSAVISQLDREGMFYQVFLEKNCSGPIIKKEKTSTTDQLEKTTFDTPKIITPPSLFANDRVLRKHSNRIDKDKIVFMFPGQGSQYKMMLSGLLGQIPELQKTLADFDSVLRKLRFPDFNDLTVKNSALLGKDVFRTQLSLLIGDSLIAKYFENQGILPDIILGHSYGEYPALVASGVWTFETAAWMTWQRCRIIEQCLMNDSNPSPNNIELFDTSSSTTMLSTNASAEQLHKLFEELWEQTVAEKSLFISNRNAPDQMIVSGTRKALIRLEEELKKRKFSAIILPVPAAYHSPLVGEVCDPLREVLDKVLFSVPKIALLSSVTMRFEADPDQFRSNLVDQMVRPVDFITMIRKAYQNGGRFFVEVGTKRVLEKLASKILADCKDIQFYHCDNGKGGNVSEFLSLASDLREIRQRITSYASAGVIQINGLNVELEEMDSDAGSSLRPEEFDRENKICAVHKTSGSPYELGYQYGQIQGDNIRKTLRRYSDLALHPKETLISRITPEILEKTELYFGKEGNEELCGIAAGAGIPYESLVRHNLSVFPVEHQNAFSMLAHRRKSSRSNCVQIVGRLSDGGLIHGGNIDIAFTRIVPDALKYSLVIRRPKGKIASVSIIPSGLIGSRGGINAQGLSVSTCDLLDEDFISAEAEGFRRGSLLQSILDNCSSLNDVMDLIQNADLCGSKTISVCDTRTGQILHMENTGKRVKITVDEKHIIQANHSLLINSSGDESQVPKHSILRYKRLLELLTPSTEGVFTRNSENILSVLRDTKEYGSDNKDQAEDGVRYRTMNMVLRLDNAFSWVYLARPGLLKVCLTESPYVHSAQKEHWDTFDIKRLLPDFLAHSAEPSVLPPVSGSFEFFGKGKTADKEDNSGSSAQIDEKEYMISDSEFFQCNHSSVYLKKEGKTEKTIERFVPRLLETKPLPDGSDPDLWKDHVQGAFLIVGESPVAELTAKKLRDSGLKVFELDPSSINEDAEDLIQKYWEEMPIEYVILDNPDDRDYVNDPKTYWEEKFKKAAFIQILACRQTHVLARKANRIHRLGFAALTHFGGDFGMGAQVDSPLGGFTSGILKALRDELHVKENIYLPIKVVDHALSESKEAVVADLLTEIRAEIEAIDSGANRNELLLHSEDAKGQSLIKGWNPFDIETGYRDGKRRVVRTIAIPKEEAKTFHGEDRDQFLSSQKGGTWIVVGGLRGITNATAYGLAQKACPDKIYLVGSSPLVSVAKEYLKYNDDEIARLRMKIMREALAKKASPTKCWKTFSRNLEMTQNLELFKKLGIEVEYIPCDTRYWSNIAGMIRSINDRKEKITGLIFGAGWAGRDASLEDLNREEALDGIYTKGNGLCAFLEELKDHPLRFAVAFSSVSGRFGGNGQVVYTAQNDLVAKTVYYWRSRRPECRFFCVEWGAWGDVGMASHIDIKGALVAAKAIFLTKETGVPCFVNEFENGLPDPEVLFVPWKYYKRFQPDGIEAETAADNAVGTEKGSLIESREETSDLAPQKDPFILSREISDSDFRNQKAPEEEYCEGVKRVARRFVDRLVEIPLLPELPEKISADPILLIGDPKNPLARELEKKILEKGGSALRFSASKEDGSLKTQEEIHTEITDLFEKTPFYTAFVLSSHDCSEPFDFNEKNWNRMENNMILGTIYAVQKWYHILLGRKELNQLRIYAATREGSSFGIVENCPCPFDGAITGMFNGINVETYVVSGTGGRCRRIEHSSDLPLEKVADDFLREYALETFRENTIYRGGHRYVVRPIHQEIEFADPSSDVHDQKMVWIITGGCRGINAEIALGLGKEFPVRLHLIGSTPVDNSLDLTVLDEKGLKDLRASVVKKAIEQKEAPVKAWQKIEKQLEIQKNFKRFQEAHIDYEYHVCDLSNRENTGTLIESLLRKESKIHGILFGAGFEKATSLEKKKPEDLRRSIDVKAGSTLAILEQLEKNPPDCIIGMGSISGRFGATGQIDYCTSNVLLGKILECFAARHEHCRSLLFHWHPWGDVGMAVRPESKLVFRSIGMDWMPAKEGVRSFLNEIRLLRNGNIQKKDLEKEVCYTEWSYYIFIHNPQIMPPYKEIKPEGPVQESKKSADPAEKSKQTAGQTEIESGDFRDSAEKLPCFVFGNNPEARCLKRHIGEKNPGDTFIFTISCDPALAKISQKIQIQRRAILIEAGMKELENWFFRYKPSASGHSKRRRILIFKGTRFSNPMNYNESEVLCGKIEKFFEEKGIRAELRPEIIVLDHNTECDPEKIRNEFDASCNSIASLKNTEKASKLVKSAKADHVQHLIHIAEGASGSDEVKGIFTVDPSKDTFLLNHKLNGDPILPFVIATEAFYEAALVFGQKTNQKGKIELQNIKAIRALLCRQNVPWNVACIADWDKDHKRIKERFIGDYYNEKGILINKNAPYFTAESIFVPDEGVRCAELPACAGLEYWDPVFPKEGKIGFYHGKPLQQLRRCHFVDEKTLLALISVPDRDDLIESRRNEEALLLDTAVLDAGFWGCGVLNGRSRKNASVIPDKISSLKMGPAKFKQGETCRCLIQMIGENTLMFGYRQILFHLVFCNEQNEIVYEIEKFQMTELNLPE
ncbi:MAG: C45 family autoproteolytic acyltransferase/hydrolase [Planctomycetia bacterium]|nr:C45 family autoproteolytic acyltransferase/hydrolase [Planctomycetia bacterium]